MAQRRHVTRGHSFSGIPGNSGRIPETQYLTRLIDPSYPPARPWHRPPTERTTTRMTITLKPIRGGKPLLARIADRMRRSKPRTSPLTLPSQTLASSLSDCVPSE